MSRLIESLIYADAFRTFDSSAAPGGITAFAVPDGKTWLISKLSTRIVTPASATNLLGTVFTKSGLRLHDIFDKGSAPTQLSAEKWDAANGIILEDQDEIRFLAEGADGTLMHAVLDFEEIDE